MLDDMTNIKASEFLKKIKKYTEDLPPYSPDKVTEALEMAIKALEQQTCEKCEPSDENNELLTSEERADVLNAINDMLEEKGFDLEVGGYEDNDGVFFDVMLMRR